MRKGGKGDMRYGWLTSKDRKRHHRAMNDIMRQINRNVENDPLWKGRFYVRQIASQWSEYEDKSGAEKCGAHTFPVVDCFNPTAVLEHEATTSKISEEQLFYCNQRGLSTEDAVGLIVNGYAREVLSKLPMEFAVEAQKLLQVSLEGSVG